MRLDFGNSFTSRRPVRDILLERLSATVHLAVTGMVLTAVVGVPLRILSAVKHDTMFDKFWQASSTFCRPLAVVKRCP